MFSACLSKGIWGSLVDQMSVYFEDYFSIIKIVSDLRKRHDCQSVLIRLSESVKSHLDDNDMLWLSQIIENIWLTPVWFITVQGLLRLTGHSDVQVNDKLYYGPIPQGKDRSLKNRVPKAIQRGTSRVTIRTFRRWCTLQRSYDNTRRYVRIVQLCRR